MKGMWPGALGLVGLAALALAACGDDDSSSDAAATGTSDGTAAATSGTSSATASATEESGGGAVTLDADFGDAGILTAAIDPAAHDRFMAVAFDEDGSFYATGFVSVAGDNAMMLAKFTEDGEPDTDFGDEGVAVVNVASGGKTIEISRSVVVLEDGKIVIGGPIEHDPSATGDAAKDTDVAVLRFNPDGTLDGDFGEEGIAIIDLSTGRQVNENTFVGDNAWGIGDLGNGRAVVFASALAAGDARTDSDLILIALDEDGSEDASFGENGRLVIDINNLSLNPRTVWVQEDGQVLATGYGNLGTAVQPIIVRTSNDGKFDTSFGDGGIATDVVLPGVAESYAVVPQGDKYISAGYGRGVDTAEKVDLIVDRWNDDGTWDTSFGEGGVTRIDLEGHDDRGRNVAVLPDGRIIAVGSGKLTDPNVDSMIVLMSEDGAIDAEFGTDGYVLTDLGGPGDAFFGVAVSPDGKSVIVAGYKGADPAGTDNDDAYLARLVIG